MINVLELINRILIYLGINFGMYGTYGQYVQEILVYLIASLLILLAASITIIIVIYVFRKYMADLQQRIGPNRVGPYGILQLVADALKIFGKEDIIPDRADPLIFRFAPYIVFTFLVLSYLVIPYGNLFGIDLTFVNVKYTLLLLIAFSAIAPIGEVLAGFSSGNKFSMLGALRAAAQDLSYEIPMVISALGVVVLLSGTGNSLNLSDIAKNPWPLAILEPIGFFVFFIAMVAKMAVVPFDLPESESELVSGFNVEYSGLRFGIFYLGVFGSIFLASLFISVVYLGGGSDFIFYGSGYIWLLIKAFIFMFIFLTLWIALPRIRVDRFMNFGWKILLPLSLINLVWSVMLVSLGVF
ncbi:MAG: NADH-quinone oxidoreductase subunit NuoH [Thermoplasmata archaeon]|jgi:NADH-quinone oxidoreductase subunit H|nr:MAG: NADH-quinone oxidoreductase subunit NuoH [Aciduliprofundum sp.]HEU12487.1 NADH-quinone oxidoreductase subunit NuoH [Euryarchaeota archaeon]